MAYLAKFPLTPQQAPAVHFAPREGKGIFDKWMHPFSAEPLAREDVPECAFVESRTVRIPELIKINGFWSFCHEVWELIERLEPGVNQFFPVTLARKRGQKPLFQQDGSPLTEPYYFSYVTQLIDTVLVEKSDVVLRAGLVQQKPGGKIVVRKELVSGHHIWVGRYHLNKSEVFFSDALVAALRERGSKGFAPEYVPEE